MPNQVAHLYKITNTKTNEYYIGKHQGTTQKKTGGGLYWGSGTRIGNAIKKYGVENFNYEVLVISTTDYIFDLEQKYVSKELIEEDVLCMNLMTGGEGRRVYSKESCEKIRMASLGRKLPEHVKQIISKVNTGNNYAKGHGFTEDGMKNLRLARAKQIISKDVYEKTSKTISSLIWMNDGVRSFRIKPENFEQSKNAGLIEGRLTNYVNNKYKEKLSMAATKQWQKARGV